MILTLWQLIKKHLNGYTLLQVMAILKALIMENPGIVRQKVLDIHFYGLAVDSADPQTVIVSASLGAWQAHSIENANSVVYRRSADGEEWKIVSNSLPTPMEQ